MGQDEKACPFCAETIKAAAIVCKHCGRDLPGTGTAQQPREDPFASVPSDLRAKALLLGITWQDERWVVSGCHFTQLHAAIEYAERDRSATPAIATAPRRGPLFWLVAIPAAAIAMFVGSAFVAGALESSGRHATPGSYGDFVESQCKEDAARARVIMDCKEIRRIAEERRNSPSTCPPEAPDCSWGNK